MRYIGPRGAKLWRWQARRSQTKPRTSPLSREPDTFKRNDDPRRCASVRAGTEQRVTIQRALMHQRRSVGDCGVL
jgi:hypothetical protein